MLPSRSETLLVRQLQYHVRHWGREDAPLLFMLHGWMDVSASFQFVVDSFRQDWHVIAPDWRGFGKTEWATGGYWFPDYLADLEVILDHYSPDKPVRLIGHSLGGNVATVYAGVRPSRVSHLVSLEGFSLMETQIEQARIIYERWLDEQKHPHKARPHPSLNSVVTRLKKINHRLSNEQALFLAQNSAGENKKGEWCLLADPKHRFINPVRYHLDEVLACCTNMTASVLLVESENSLLRSRMGGKEKGEAELARRASFIPHASIVEVPDAGHMMHHDQPRIVAHTIEAFVASHP